MKIHLRADASAMEAAIAELNGLLDGKPLELDGVRFAHLRELFVDGILDASKLVRVDSNPTADGTHDVLVSLQPSELFLELLAACRAGNGDDVRVEAECHGGAFQ